MYLHRSVYRCGPCKVDAVLVSSLSMHTSCSTLTKGTVYNDLTVLLTLVRQFHPATKSGLGSTDRQSLPSVISTRVDL